MTQDEQKESVAKAALEYIPENTIIGVGTGSTVNYFIDFLATIKHKIQGAVASSNATETRLKSWGIPIIDLNTALEVEIYIDSADAYNPYCQLVKGGGGALTREKILATASHTFLCIVDESKETKIFGTFPIPIEVIPMARSFVAREIVKLEGTPVYRPNFITDNGNVILDVYHWVIAEPIKLERTLNNIPGVVGNGLFAEKPANMLLISTQQGIKIIKNKFN
ncbi:MAG TPA: ribose-5-phosphate isomerase RpiA [Gammaproteobacteria bacterium]|nr:ribose-5-phosphate isomerase RpiA [Gammaproteobacteria bacterium]